MKVLFTDNCMAVFIIGINILKNRNFMMEVKHDNGMKRSEINRIIRDAELFFREQGFHLPAWADWSPGQWKGVYESCSEIIDNKLGWDITDFGTGDFRRRGLVLFTIRNGNWEKQDKTYCEKIMIADENQETPFHFHWNKTEDIINRGGGDLVMEIFRATADEAFDDRDVELRIDGVKTVIGPGGKIILEPGQSISLEPRVYHRFYGKEGKGRVMIGEVSAVNDDQHDNRFKEQLGRFPEIEEDEEAFRLLVSDYEKYV